MFNSTAAAPGVNPGRSHPGYAPAGISGPVPRPTFSEVLPATKSSRHSGIRWTPGEHPGTGTLTIDTDRARVVYVCHEFPSPMGRAFRLTKRCDSPGTDRMADAYDVLVANPQDRLCCCKGFSRFGHCKHTDAVLALLENGWV